MSLGLALGGFRESSQQMWSLGHSHLIAESVSSVIKAPLTRRTVALGDRFAPLARFG